MFDLYLFTKALHLFAVISWMVGLLYLPRLFVYHAQATTGGEASETFKVMERRLLKGIMNPAMLGAWILGIALLFLNLGLFSTGWIYIKLVLLVALTAIHMFYGKCRKDFENDTNQRTHKFYRIINEVPAVCMILILLLAVMKPF